MCTPSTSSNAEALLDQFQCPVALEPLFEAVSLMPCAHKVQQAVAKQIFGATKDGWKVESDKPCPVCRASVFGYMVDHSTRGIVKQLFELPESELHAMLSLVKKDLFEKCASVAKDAVVDMPYPGKPARFIHNGGDWNLFNSGGALCRDMEFKSSTEGSLLKKISLFGYCNGDVAIRIDFLEDAKGLADYFKKFDLILDRLDLNLGSYRSKNQDQLRCIFNIIARRFQPEVQQ